MGAVSDALKASVSALSGKLTMIAQVVEAEATSEVTIGGDLIATGDVTVRGGGGLTGTELAGEQVVRCLDEVPVLAVVATRAAGTTVIRDAAELRVKESDRFATTCELLRRLGARVDERPDGLAVEGDPAARLSPFAFDAPGDHRLVMAAAVAALAADGECEVGPTETPATSWPGFWETLEGLADR